MENSVSSAALNAAREQLDAAEAAREVILLQHIANGVIIDSRTVQIAPDVVIARVRHSGRYHPARQNGHRCGLHHRPQHPH